MDKKQIKGEACKILWDRGGFTYEEISIAVSMPVHKVQEEIQKRR